MKEQKQTVREDQKKLVRRLSVIGIAGNVLLSAFKMAAGILGHSGAMLSDAVHSLSDVFATLIAFLGTRLAGRQADDEHPYGHERFECIASLLLGLLLAAAGAAIGYTGVRKLLTGSYKTGTQPGLLPLIAAAVSILSKEAMFRYTLFHARKMNSVAFEADAWHHRSDALSSVGALIGIAAARFGLPFMEPAASLVICLCILKVAFDITRKAFSEMTDTSCGAGFERQLRSFVASCRGVERVDLLHTRMFGSMVYVDLEIAVRGEMTLTESHAIAENVHTEVEAHFPSVKHVMIHVNPC